MPHRLGLPMARGTRRTKLCGAVAEWSKALAWKVSMGQKPIVGSNPTRSAIYSPRTFSDVQAESEDVGNSAVFVRIRRFSVRLHLTGSH